MTTKTLWDEYALAAMQRVNCDSVEEAAMHCTAYADAMMAERAKRLTDAKPDWIEWNGGECPIHEDTMVEIRFRDGEELDQRPAKAFDWAHGSEDYGPDCEIIAYRIVSHEK